MFKEEKLEKVVLSREEFNYYQQLRKQARVYDAPNYGVKPFRANKNRHYKKRY